MRALYQYEAAADTELAMEEGDVITVLKEDESGWWQARPPPHTSPTLGARTLRVGVG